jgi:large subunit ribosomal protein L10
MSYFVKSLVRDEYESKFDGVKEFVVVNMTGTSGVDNNILRGELKKKGIRMTVVKNSLMRLALQKLEMGGACPVFGSGPCTVAYGGDSAVDVAKELVNWSKKLKTLEFRGAFVDGVVLDAAGAKELSKMPNRAQLQGQVAQLILSPGAAVAGALLGPGGVIAGCVKSVIEKLEKEAA